ncbi:hypothetical protein BK703_16600 [Bacillus thuringiensis serovar silo]|nr:hypothetical protein BK703_16600 [Bacillus thuringiensis serovar silo]OTW74309.1 hypothetical protein BK700_01445 [Bacillus thuringiensis serovar toguchini]
MILSNTFVITERKRRTSSKLFKTVKVSDEIELRYDVNGYYQKSPMIDVCVNGEYSGLGYPHQIKEVMDRAFTYREASIL